MWTRKGSSGLGQQRPEVLTRMSEVSVITTVLNEVGDIEQLVTSLMGQTLCPAEVVVVDGGSTDGTWEWLKAASNRYPSLIAIRDESCSLKGSPGPIARGRNVAITAALSPVIACADAGCVYSPEWLERLTAPIVRGKAEYALGGSCIDAASRTIWDIASAPFLGIKLWPDETTKSCTGRSMAFRKGVWQRVGGFPETVFLIDDTLFDLRVRKIAAPAFVEQAKAVYRPSLTVKTAANQLARYAVADGAAGVRRPRLFRNLARCVVELIAIALLPRTAIPFLCVLALETYFAFRLDWDRFPEKRSPRALGARLLFSLMAPWVVTWNYLAGAITKTVEPNAQNSPTAAVRRQVR
jgi:glycosyltransferase involved in cell wall biosynthesis